MNFDLVRNTNGVLIVDKPTEWTSHDVCSFIRKRFRIRKVGHAGTLDPLATGALVVLLGKATKQSIALSSCDKDYFGMMELGVRTDSHDRDGNVLATAPWESVTLETIREKAQAFTGEITQVPPMVSALKQGGVRLYKLARQGQTVPRQGRQVTVYELRMEKQEGPFVHFFSRVSKGTYLRTLINDLGESLGCLATLAQLRRVRCGDYGLDNSMTIDMLRQCTNEEFLKKIYPIRSLSSHAHFKQS